MSDEDDVRALLRRNTELENENTSMLGEVNRLYSEIDRYRTYMEKLADHPDAQVSQLAKAAMGKVH